MLVGFIKDGQEALKACNLAVARLWNIKDGLQSLANCARAEVQHEWRARDSAQTVRKRPASVLAEVAVEVEEGAIEID